MRRHTGGAAVVAESGGERAGAGLEGGAVFSRNNNLSLSNKRGRSERSGRAALRTLANKCWRNKILLPNNIRGRSLLLLNSAALCSVTIPAKLWPPPSSNLAPRDLLTAHRRESLLHRPSSANFRLRFSNNVSFVFAFRIHDRILTIYIYIDTRTQSNFDLSLVDLCQRNGSANEQRTERVKRKFSPTHSRPKFSRNQFLITGL